MNKKRIALLAVMFALILGTVCLAGCAEKTYSSTELGFVMPDKGIASVKLSWTLDGTENLSLYLDASDEKFDEAASGISDFAKGFSAIEYKRESGKNFGQWGPARYLLQIEYEEGEKLEFYCGLQFNGHAYLRLQDKYYLTDSAGLHAALSAMVLEMAEKGGAV